MAETAWGASASFTLRAGQNTQPLDAVVQNMDAGAYYAADFVFWNRWTIQAFCRTANAFLYTSSAGVMSLPSTPSSMPPDYGPLAYDYMPGVPFLPDGSNNAQSQAHQTFINSAYDYFVDRKSTVTLYLDASYVVSCYDGTANSSSSGMIAPQGQEMSYGTQPGAFTVPFNWTAPSFGFSDWSLPVFVAVTSGGGSSVGETYAFATNRARLPIAGTPADWSLLSIVTITWSDASPAATLLDMRVRGSGSGNVRGGSSGANGTFNFGGLFNFTASPATPTTLSWSWYNGGQFYQSYLYRSERVFAGFIRTTDLVAIGSVTETDGPQCGLPEGGGGNSSTPCMSSTATLYYVQLPRTG